MNSWIADSKLGVRLPAFVRRAITVKKMPKDQVVAVCLCGAAKTQALGIPLADAMWAQSPDLTRSLIQIPILLYTMEQVFTAQFLTILFRWWLQKDKKRTSDEESDTHTGETPGSQLGPGGGNIEGQAGADKVGQTPPTIPANEKALV